MKRILTGWAVGAALLGVAYGEEGLKLPPRDPKAATEITSEKLTFDYNKKIVVFEKNVVVKDPALRLTADRLTVTFTEAQDLKMIMAQGNVRITKEDIVADSRLATYDVGTGRISLDGEPRVIRGKDVLTGTSITFWRDKNTMICEPNATLVIHPDAHQAGKFMPVAGN